MNFSSSDKEFLAEYIVESDAIEGITRDRSEVLGQIESGHVRGHVGAYNFLLPILSEKQLLSESMIKEMQALIVSEQEEFGVPALDPSDVGQWRTTEVSVGGRSCPPAWSVPNHMTDQIRLVRDWQRGQWRTFTQEENLCFVAAAHFAYLHVHPFRDGNGRSSRAIAYYLMRHVGLTPFIFTASDRHEAYYRCFERPKDMMNYFLARSHFPTLPE